MQNSKRENSLSTLQHYARQGCERRRPSNVQDHSRYSGQAVQRRPAAYVLRASVALQISWLLVDIYKGAASSSQNVVPPGRGGLPLESSLGGLLQNAFDFRLGKLDNLRSRPFDEQM
jgi:hypothetical protein